MKILAGYGTTLGTVSKTATESLQELQTGLAALQTGTVQLQEGSSQLEAGMAAFGEGIRQLYQGSAALHQGADNFFHRNCPDRRFGYDDLRHGQPASGTGQI